MAKTKLVSVRVDEDVLQVIDRFCEQHTYFYRSFVINAVLRFVTRDFKSETLWSIMNKYLIL